MTFATSYASVLRKASYSALCFVQVALHFSFYGLCEANQEALMIAVMNKLEWLLTPDFVSRGSVTKQLVGGSSCFWRRLAQQPSRLSVLSPPWT